MSCRELFKKLNILPVPCVYIMEMVHYIKINMEGLKQNLVIMSMRHDIEPIFKHISVELIFLKKCNQFGDKTI